MTRVLRLLKYFLLLLVVIAGLVLHNGNPEPISFNYYFGTVEQPLAVFLAVTLAIGALLGMLAGLLPALSMRREIRRVRRQAASPPPRPEPPQPANPDVA